MRRASETSLKALPSASKVQEEPASSTSSPSLVVAEQQLVAEVAPVVAVGRGHGRGAVPLDLNDRHSTAGKESMDARAGRDLFESCHGVLVWARTGSASRRLAISRSSSVNSS